MSLVETWTARISTRDPDALDITRKTGGRLGRVFAPSWNILRPALDARNEAQQLRRMADAMGPDPEAEAKRLRADDIERRAWAAYEPAYLAEMRAIYACSRERDSFAMVLARRRVVLVCYCTDPARCHRTLLAGVFGKLGADVRGELAT